MTVTADRRVGQSENDTRGERRGRPDSPRALRYKSYLRRGAIVVALVTVWAFYTEGGSGPSLTFASPSDVLSALWAGWTSGELASATGTTIQLLLVSMLIGVVIASLLATLAIWSRWGADLLLILTSMFNPLPAIAILPLAVLWFGLNSTSLVFVVANAVTWPFAVNLSMGYQTVNGTLISVGRNIGLRGWPLVRDVYLPASLPHIVSGLKTAWAFAWRTIVAAELVFGVAGGGGGLGYYINDARYFLRIPEVFAGLVTIAALGILVELLFNLVQKFTVERWGMKAS